MRGEHRSVRAPVISGSPAIRGGVLFIILIANTIFSNVFLLTKNLRNLPPKLFDEESSLAGLNQKFRFRASDSVGII